MDPIDDAGPVYTHCVDAAAHASDHERATQVAIARRLAALLGRRFGGEAPAGPHAPGDAYWVPNDTIVGTRAARALGIRGASDLFGGVVPHAFVATKAIAHPLAGRGAFAPAGWSASFARRVRSCTLPGVTAFARDDALDGARRLLADGPVRIKPATATGGHGQSVAGDRASLAALLDEVGPGVLDAPDATGLVVEHDLAEPGTYSVGRIEAGGVVLSYLGSQQETRDNRGDLGYGGSTLTVVRGDFDALAARIASAREREALALARAFDDAAFACFPGLVASRRNYDVIDGVDAAGRRRCGVLEQSWRVGGASPAEVAALAALARAPAGAAVRASCVERFGAQARPPAGVDVYFDGVDAHEGPLVKYAWSEPIDDPR